jgi:hypothetical protein
LGDNFASGCFSLKSINTDNITKLYSKAFSDCYSLQKLNLSNLVELEGAFLNSGLEEINLPNLTTWLASSTF